MITDLLHAVRTSLQVKGITPTDVFLGEDEWAELEDYARDSGFVPLNPQTSGEGARLEWEGLKVYVVNAKSYVNMA